MPGLVSMSHSELTRLEILRRIEDRAVVHAQLARECADGPAFRVIQPQALGLERARDHWGHDLPDSEP
jgi:hypothetical protein